MPSDMKPSTDQVLTKTSRGFGLDRALGVALGDVDALDAEVAHQPRPALAVVGPGLVEGVAEVAGKIDQRLLDEPRHHAGIGAAAGDGGGAARVLRLLVAHGRAQRIVGARFGIGRGVEIEAGPRLDHGVDVGHAELAAEAHDLQRRGVDRQVDAEAGAAAFGEQRGQHLAEVLRRQLDIGEADALPVEQRRGRRRPGRRPPCARDRTRSGARSGAGCPCRSSRSRS